MSAVPAKRFKSNTIAVNTIKITDLPDDCLIYIFKRLCVEDLMAAFHSTSRFYYAIDACFLSKYKQIVVSCDAHQRYHIRPQEDCMEKVMNEGSLSEKTLESTFKYFGKHFTAITVYNMPFAPVIRYANQYCSENMKSLTMYRSAISPKTIEGCQELFKRLEKLDVIEFINKTWETCWEWCDNLKHLSIYRDANIKNPLLMRIYPKLESVVCDFDVESIEEMCASFERHPNLKVIEIRNTFVPTTQSINCMQNVEKLSISVSFADLDKADWIKLFQLKHLKYLHIFSDIVTYISEFLLKITSNPSTNLEILDLYWVCFNDVCALLTTFTFTNLKTLSVRAIYGFNPNAVPNMNRKFFENLKNVEELQFVYYPKSFFERIVLVFVENMRNLKRLLLVPDEDTITLDVIQELAEVQKSKKTMLTVYYADISDSVMQTIKEQQRNSNSNLRLLDFKKAKLDTEFKAAYKLVYQLM